MKLLSPDAKKLKVAGISFFNGERIVTGQFEAARLVCSSGVKITYDSGKPFNLKKNRVEFVTDELTMDELRELSDSLNLVTKGKTKSQLVNGIIGVKTKK